LPAHLLSKAQFDAVFAGRMIAKSPHFALHYVAAQALAVGVVVPKRWARRAVTRNTIRRQVYAVSDTQTSSLALGHYVVRLRSEFSRQDFPSARSVALKQLVRSELVTLMAHKP
jgi:ribonuclease P protein component